MKQKLKLFFAVIVGITVLSCQNDEFDPLSNSQEKTPTLRAAGDQEYDVLGHGYDIMGEYLHPLSVKNPVLDINKYKENNKKRLVTGTPSWGSDHFFYGYSATDYVEDITKETNVKVGANLGGKILKVFTGSITANNFLKTESSYSSKYSFASLDAIRNRKYIRINDDIINLSNYLSDEFKADLKRYSADRIVEEYGTHVLTDFVIGGRYKLMYKTAITKIKNSSTKKEAVASGFDAALKGIGLSINVDRTVTINRSLVSENHSRELFVFFLWRNRDKFKV